MELWTIAEEETSGTQRVAGRGGMGTEERARPGAGRQGQERVVQRPHKVGAELATTWMGS